jgi:hypothetical protein
VTGGAIMPAGTDTPVPTEAALMADVAQIL